MPARVLGTGETPVELKMSDAVSLRDTMTVHLRRWHVVSTVAILALSITSALLGLFRPGHYADSGAFLRATITQDAVVLLVEADQGGGRGLPPPELL